MSRFSIFLLAMILATTFLHGCAGQRLPIDILKKDLRDVPSYSINLEDMDEKGTFFKSYYHKYRIVQGERTGTTDWMKVPEDYYQKNENFLGMTLLSKKEGQYDTSVGPPGYNYVGDTQYGKWQRDSSGNSFWAFYGKYALISHLLGGSRDLQNRLQYLSGLRPSRTAILRAKQTIRHQRPSDQEPETQFLLSASGQSQGLKDIVFTKGESAYWKDSVRLPQPQF